MKNLVSLLLLAIFSLPAFSQSISIFDIDTTNFPTMKAKFYAFDKDGNIQRPSANELTLKENGIVRTIKSVNCPFSTQLKQLSSVLVVDVSGSMKEDRGTGVTNLDLAKTAANSWIKGLPLGNSECAITSFDGYNYFIQDYTSSRTKLLNAIEKLNPLGSTNYEAALLQPLAGGLVVTKTAKYKKVIIFLSDGLPNFEPNTAKIIAEAKLQGCTIFCVTLGLPAPQCMKDMAAQTGGNYFENVTTIAEAERVYNSILQQALGSEPCKLEWESEAYCDLVPKSNENVDISFEYNNNQALSKYRIPFNSFKLIKVTPGFVSFGKVAINQKKDTTLTLTAVNSDFIINDIKVKNGAKQFSIKNITFPYTIKKNSSVNIVLSLNQLDSSFNYVTFEVLTNLCSSYFSANGGMSNKSKTTQTLKLVKPNGKEIFVVGQDTNIIWEGISPTDMVSLEYSFNNGNTWNSITSSTRGLKDSWKNIPKPTSNNCLVRVEQKQSIGNTTLYKTLIKHKDYVNTAKWSPDGSKVITASNDSTAIVWDAIRGNVIKILKSHTDYVNDASWSPDGSIIATASKDGSIILWSSLDYKLISILKVSDPKNIEIYKIVWSNDGTRIATVSKNVLLIWNAFSGKLLVNTMQNEVTLSDLKWSKDDNKIACSDTYRDVYIINSTTGTKIFTISEHWGNVRSIDWNPENTKIVTTGDDNKVIICDALKGTKDIIMEGHSIRTNKVTWNPNGKYIASAGYDNKIIIWDAKTYGIVAILDNHTFNIKDINWNKDGSLLVSASEDGKSYVWESEKWNLVSSLIGHDNTVKTAYWSPDENFIVTASEDYTARIWNANVTPLQSDISDSVFSIVAPTPLGRDVDMKECLVAAVKDSVVSDFMQNVGSYRFRTDSIYFSGADASAFQLVSGIPRYELEPGKTKFAELRFMPKKVGKHTAKINIIAGGDTLVYNITGVGVQPMLQVVNNIIDFGKIKVGASKDSIQANTIKNTGTVPITITKTLHAGPNDIDFTTLSGAAPFTLQPGETAKMNLRFNAKSRGRTSGQLKFEYNGVGSPAVVQLFAEGLPADTNCEGRSFVFRNFNLTSQVVKNGTSFITPDSTVRLTESKSNEVGGISYSEKVSLLSSFVMKFSFRFSNGVNSFMDGSLPGADGIAVLFQNGRGFRTTENGGSLGYNGIINCVALEMDMYRNSDFNDPNGNHVALQIPYKDTITSEHNAQRTFKMNENIFVLRPDSTVYYGVVKFDANKKHLDFYLDSNKSANNLVMSVDDFDFSRHLKLEYGDFAYIGITGSTGASVQTHEILSWEFCSDRDEVLSVENGFYESEELVQNENTISLSQGQIKSIKIIDFLGKTIFEEEVNTAKIDINKYNLSTGMYYIIAKDEMGRSYFKKVSLVK